MGHTIETLVRHKNGYAGICKCCGTYNVAYKNMLFSLNEAEFDWFKSMLSQKEIMSEFRTSHGKELLLSTPIPNYFILLKYAEITQLLGMLHQCSLIVEARRIYKIHRTDHLISWQHPDFLSSFDYFIESVLAF